MAKPYLCQATPPLSLPQVFFPRFFFAKKKMKQLAHVHKLRYSCKLFSLIREILLRVFTTPPFVLYIILFTNSIFRRVCFIRPSAKCLNFWNVRIVDSAFHFNERREDEKGFRMRSLPFHWRRLFSGVRIDDEVTQRDNIDGYRYRGGGASWKKQLSDISRWHIQSLHLYEMSMQDTVTDYAKQKTN